MTEANDRNDAISRRTDLGSDREKLPLLVDYVNIALESLRTQWRTVESLGTHERMAISQLRVYGAMPMSELAARISLSRAAITSLVDRLESEKWVRRIPDENDRRRTVLDLEPSGRKRFSDVSEAFSTSINEYAAEMSDDDFAAVSKFLLHITKNAEKETATLRATALERSLS